jgi:hypothetical protein
VNGLEVAGHAQPFEREIESDVHLELRRDVAAGQEREVDPVVIGGQVTDTPVNPECD